MALAFLAILGLSTFPNGHEEEILDISDDLENSASLEEVTPGTSKLFPSRPIALSVLGALTISGLVQLTCSLWQHVATVTASSVGGSLTNSTIDFKVGSASIAFGWISCILIILTAFGLRVIVDSIRILAEIVVTDGDDEMDIVLKPRE
jgi:hypothetical protein